MRVALPIVLILLTALTCRAWADDSATDVPVGELAGVVTDEAGQPMEGVLVDCWTWHPGNETKTDKAGHFHLNRLRRDGPIEVRISKPGYSPWYEVNQPTGVGDLKVTLNDKTFFEGTVLAPDGKPVPNAVVRADTGLKVNQQVHITHVWTETTADANGHYKLFVAPDNYSLLVRDPKIGVAYSQVTANANEGVARDIHLEEGLRFVIHCVDDADSQPIPGVRVNVNYYKGIKATSDDKGDAVFEHLFPAKLQFGFESGTHMRWWMAESLVAEQHDLKSNEGWSYRGAEIDLSAAGATGGGPDPVTTHFEKGATFSGRVVDPQGKPVVDAIVVTNRVGYADAVDSTQRFTAYTDEDGAFSFAIPACEDRVNLIAHDGDYGKTRHWANGVTDALDATAGAAHEGLTIQLTVPATIRGQVITPSGSPAADKWVRVVGADDRDSRYTAPDAHTDADGKFELKFVRPGDVLVQVEPFIMRRPDGPLPKIAGTTLTIEPEEVKDDVQVTATQR